jgi:nucleoside-diphosphate-sugar epimerase
MEACQLSGASGFVGLNLQTYLANDFEVIPLSIRYKKNQVIDLKASHIIHAAGKAHDVKHSVQDSYYYEANYELTKQVFDAFLQSDAKTFIFISSVKAVADEVPDLLMETTLPNPVTAYGKSKKMAEDYLFGHNLPAGKKVYILRPCMIHGPGNKGNLNLLYQLVSKGLPWPLGNFENQRSFLSIENLCFVIKELLKNETIPIGIYQVADNETVSTNELIQIIGESLGKKNKIWNIPSLWINRMARLGDYLHLPITSERLQKLTENYVVSNDKIVSAIGKSLPVSACEGLLKTFQSFKNGQ